MAGYYESSRRAETSFMSISSFASPFKLSVGKDGTADLPRPSRACNGAPRYYREVAPFVWRDVDSGWRLAAKVVDGHVQRFSIDEISPFTVYEPSSLVAFAELAHAGGGVCVRRALADRAAVAGRRDRAPQKQSQAGPGRAR